MVRDNTTPRPYSQPYVSWQDQSQDEALTPNWLRDVRDVRHAPAPTPMPVYGRANKLTELMARRLPMKAEIRIPTLEPCWDCDGLGTMAGSRVTICKICDHEWSQQRCREHGHQTMAGFQLPCTHVIKGRRFEQITWIEAECPTCCNHSDEYKRAHPFLTGPGYLPAWRTMEELYQWFYERAERDTPTEEGAVVRFAGSEPTVTTPPLPLPPLPPDDGKEF